MDSLDYKKYKKKLLINKILVIFTQITLLILLLIIWQLLADFELINTFISSSPKKVIEKIGRAHV